MFWANFWIAFIQFAWLIFELKKINNTLAHKIRHQTFTTLGSSVPCPSLRASIVCEHVPVHDSTRKQTICKTQNVCLAARLKSCPLFVNMLGFTIVHASKIYSNKSHVVYLFAFCFYVLLICEYGSEQNAAKQIYSQFITYVVCCIIIAHGHHMLHMIYCVGSRNGSTSLTLTLALCFSILPYCRPVRICILEI